MELSYWIYFKPGEKDKLKQIIDENPNPLMANIAIQEEFGDHMTIVCYDMDTTDNFEDMKRVYDEHVEQIIDFDQDDYGYGPLVFLEGYIAILGAANEDNYVDHLINAIEKKKMDQPGENETYYYLKDGLVKE